MDAEVVDKEALRSLQQRRPWEVTRRLALDWLQIFAFYAIAAWIDHIAVYVVATLLIGTRQHALALLAHDGAHGLFARNKRWNDFLTNFLCMWPLGATVEGYREFHLQHHRHLGSEQDPEMSFSVYDVPVTPAGVARRAMLDSIGLGLPMVSGFILKIRPTRALHNVPALLWQVALVAVCVAIGQLWIALLWFGGEFSSFAVGFRLRSGSEHHGLRDRTHRFEPTLLSRYLYLPHNTYCHYEHHRYASVPCYNLPQLRKLLDRDVPIGTELDVLRALGSR
jgi:fatty acid desaturase